jgi:DNA-binding LacI/PurR family transcriptional regulator
MSDVAARAGVSHQTVSRVVNGSTFVRPDTKERVLEAIVELGYRRNPAARALVTRRSGVVGVVVADLRYYGPSSTVIGIESAARAAGCSTILASLPDVTADAVEGALEHVMSAGAEAVVVIGHHDTGLDLGRGSEYGVPIVVLDGETSRSSLAVGVDQRAGAVIVTQHLIDLGHRRIAHLSGPPSWFQAQQRLEGWRLTLEHAGLPVSTPLTGDWSAAGGYLLGQQLAADRQVTAVFAANDQMAIGVLRALVEAGRRVPDEVSVVGFDDIPEAGFLSPPLTTVRQDFEALGEHAMRMVLGSLKGHLVRSRLVPPQFIARESTRAPKPPRSKAGLGQRSPRRWLPSTAMRTTNGLRSSPGLPPTTRRSDMHCFAGHAVRISGHRFAWSDETETSCALDDRGLRVCVGSLARDLLGLTGDEAVDLFYAEDRAEIDRVVAAVEHRGAQLLLRESEDIDTRPCSSGRTMPDSLAYPIVAPYVYRQPCS